MNFDVAVIQTPIDSGITKAQAIGLMQLLHEDEVISLYVEGEHVHAHGFIGNQAAEQVNLNEMQTFLAGILNDTGREVESGIYEYNGLRVFIGYDLPSTDSSEIVDTEIEVAIIRWVDADLRSAMERRNISPTNENVEKFMDNRGPRTLQEQSIAAGWDILDSILSDQQFDELYSSSEE